MRLTTFTSCIISQYYINFEISFDYEIPSILPLLQIKKIILI